MTSFDRLGDELRRALGDGPGSPEHRERQRRAVLNAVAEPTRPALRWPRWALAGAIGLAAATGAYFAFFRASVGLLPESELVCHDEQGNSVRGGQWLNADRRDKTLVFNEGTQVRFAKDSRGRLDKLTPSEVELSLEAGAVRSSVTPGRQVVWGFRAGPYRVRVVGTELAVHFTPADERFVTFR